METSNVKVAGLTEVDRVLNTMTGTRIISFPDGIDRSFTLLGRQWFIYDVYQLKMDDPKYVATAAYNHAKEVAADLSLDESWFEPDVRYVFENIINTAAPFVEMPGETDGGNDNTPGQ